MSDCVGGGGVMGSMREHGVGEGSMGSERDHRVGEGS